MGTWARSKGKPRPKTKEGIAKLLLEFMADQPSWYEVTGDPRVHLGWNGVQTQILDAMHGTPDDFDELVENRTKAMVEGHGDDLSRDALMITGDRAALVQEAPFQRANPPSILDTPIGGQATVINDGKRKEVARWAGTDAETSAVTVTFGPVAPLDTLPVGPIVPGPRPFGVVKFGTRGFLSELAVDIGRGVQFTVTGSTVILEVGMEEETFPPAQNQQLTFTGMLSFHPTEKNVTITRTFYAAGVTNAAGFLVRPVPNFSENLIVFRNDEAAAFSLTFADRNSNPRYVVSIPANVNMAQPVPLAGDIFVVSLSTTSVTNVTFRLIFGLAI